MPNIGTSLSLGLFTTTLFIAPAIKLFSLVNFFCCTALGRYKTMIITVAIKLDILSNLAVAITNKQLLFVH